MARPLLDISVEGLDQLSAGAVIGSFFAVLLLFAPPVTLLGMVAPFAIRLGDLERRRRRLRRGASLRPVDDREPAGHLLSALVLIPLIGTQRTLLVSAAIVALAGSFLLSRRWLLVPVGIAALLAVPTGAIKPHAGLLHEDESLYQYIQVVERGDAHRLYLNEGIAVHSVWRAGRAAHGRRVGHLPRACPARPPG